MKYGMLQKGMWLMFRGSFAKAAESELSVKDGKELMRKAKRDYRIILDGIPEFDPESRFLVNILSCAMVVALLKNLEEKPDVDTVRTFYKKPCARTG